MTTKIHKFTCLLAIFLATWAGAGRAAVLQDVQFSELPGEKTEIRLKFDSAPTTPSGYTIDSPSRIVLDFADTDNALAEKKFSVSVGEVSSAVVVAGGGRTRLIVNLDNLVPYESRTEGSDYVIEVGAESAVGGGPSIVSGGTSSASFAQEESQFDSSVAAISNIDFRRGDVGEGKVIITLTNPNIAIDVEEVSGGVDVRFLNTELPVELRRKLDVVDFATPVKILSSGMRGDDAVLGVKASGEYDYLAYQAENEYVISVKPLTQQEIEQKKKKFEFTGERLSLNFQDIEVRSVLQVIAEFTDLNLVASDTVSGSITLRLENVPWDQALDIVLKAKGLDKRLVGNVLMVAPAAEIAERERQEIDTKKQLEELAPLRTEYIRIRYANAAELFSLFMDSGGQGGAGAGNASSERTSTGSILSERGHAIVDERTNSIILSDTEERINDFKELIDRIDVPVRQVMIEARIVIANNDFRKELGVRVSASGYNQLDEITAGPNGEIQQTLANFSGRQEGLQQEDGAGFAREFFRDADGDGVSDGTYSQQLSRVIDLGVAAPTGSLALNLISSNFLLGMELSALEESGFAEIVSQPKVITGDKQEASIESGSEVPFLEESASGGATVQFKDAVLKLLVTPQITPDDRVIMDLEINQDSISGQTASGVPIIAITQLETQVLVNDGETVVLGGIYQTDHGKSVFKVPLLGDIPVVGNLFKKRVNRENKRELLIFVTPRIMDSDIVE